MSACWSSQRNKEPWILSQLKGAYHPGLSISVLPSHFCDIGSTVTLLPLDHSYYLKLGQFIVLQAGILCAMD